MKKKSMNGKYLYWYVLRKAFFAMKLTALILLITTFSLMAGQSYSQEKRISLNMRDVLIKDVLLKIENSSEYFFIYNNQLVDVDRKVSISVDNEKISEVLHDIFQGQKVDFQVTDRKIIIAPLESATTQQQKTVSGKVSDSAGGSLPGVSVVIKGTTVGTITDSDGNFKLSNVPANATLQFSFVGMKSQEIVVGNKTTVDVKLEDETIGLEEVVAVGYGTVRKKDITGSVSSIGQDKFNVGVVTSPALMMQGRVSGVTIMSNGGEPGAGLTVKVRGSNSIRSGQDPLYVVDGIPLDITDNQPTNGSMGTSSKKDPLNFLNPEDIESIDILKDASATAIYGSRGSNGVVIITTKKGKEGIRKINYSNYVAISNLPKQIDVLSSDEFRAEMAANNLIFNDKKANTNWQDEIYRTAISNNHNLSFSGGEKNAQYRASLSYMNQEGIIKKSGLEKYTGRLTFSQTALKDRLKIDGTITIARTNDQRAALEENGGYEGDVILCALKTNPTFPVYNADGTYYQSAGDVYNPVALVNLIDDKTQTDRMLFNLSGSLKIIDGLNFRINVGMDENKVSRRITQNQQLIYLSDGGTVNINNMETGSHIIENMLTYDTTIKSIHKLNLMAGMSYQSFKYYTYGIFEKGFNVLDINYLNDFTYGKNTAVSANSDVTKNELQSFFGRINYSLKEKYLLTANFRADGSTKFGANNKYGYFPSTALAWRLSEEKFIKKFNVIDNLKLRLGWGLTGNQEIPNKISQERLGSVTGTILDGSTGNVVTGLSLTRTPNPDIKWEKTYQSNIGLDFGFWGNKLSGSIDYFKKVTKDVLLQVYSISPAPTSQVWTNIPDMKIMNKGFELTLNTLIVNKKDFSWDLGLNFSTYKNIVKDSPMSQISSATASGPGILNNVVQVIMNDYPIGTFWGKKFLGFDTNGLGIYEKDENGNDKNQVIGDANPDFTVNVNSTLKYKRVDLRLFLNGVFGNDIYNNLGNIIKQKSMFPKEWNMTKDAAKSDESLKNGLVVSNRFIEDGSYLRLASATLGYTFNTTKIDWLGKAHFYIAGNNLLTITKYSGYDPEVNSDHSTGGIPSIGIAWSNYPKARTITVGLNIEF